MQSPIRLIIADDHALFRQGLKLLLALQDDLTVVAEVERAGQLIPIVAATPCDVVLLDLQMDRWVAEEIAPLAHRAPVCVLTASERIEDAMDALRKGARAIVHKRFAVETLAEAIRTVAGGMVWVPPMLQAELAAQTNATSARRLTARESEIVRHIAARLAISEGTVKIHLNRIFQKLAIRDRVELTLYALREHLVTAPGRGRWQSS